MRYSVVLLFLLACSDPSASGPSNGDFPDPPLDFSDAGEGTVSYQADVAPIFREKCIACHYSGSRLDLDLANPFDPDHGIINRPNTWTEARSTVVVVPGRPEKSALVDKIEATDLDHDSEGDAMPFQTPALLAEEVAAITKWVEDGAKDDAFFRDSVAPIFGDGESFGRKAGKCSYCHTKGGLYAPDLAHPFDAKTGVVGVKANVGGFRVVAGDAANSVLIRKIAKTVPAEYGAPMPRNFAKLSATQVETVKTWISEGARNN